MVSCLSIAHPAPAVQGGVWLGHIRKRRRDTRDDEKGLIRTSMIRIRAAQIGQTPFTLGRGALLGCSCAFQACYWEVSGEHVPIASVYIAPEELMEV